VELARAEGVENLASRALITLGGAYFQQDKAEAGKYYSRALEIARRNRAAATEARAHLSLGSLYSSMGEPEKAVNELRPAAAFFRQAGYPSELFQAGILLGRSQRDLGDFEGAERIFRDLLAASQRDGSREEKAFLNEAIGQVLMRKENYRAAAGEFAASRQLYSEVNAATGVAYQQANLGAVQWRLGNYQDAGELFKAAGEFAVRAGSADLSNSVKMEQMRMAVSREDFAEAHHIGLELANARPVLVERDRALLTALTAVVLAKTGHPGQAIERCSEAVRSARDLRIENLTATALTYCSEVALLAKNREQSRQWAAEAQSVFRRTGQAVSEWKAGALLALAGAPDARTAATTAFEDMQKEWDAGDFRRFLSRPDVKRLHDQLVKLELK